MKKSITLKPRDGLQVRRPDGRVLTPAGETVPDSPYWRRRLRDGDVVKTTAKRQAKAAAATKSEE